MNVSSVNFDPTLLGISQMPDASIQPVMPDAKVEAVSKVRDSYTPSAEAMNMDMDIALPSQTYGRNGMEIGDTPRVSQMSFMSGVSMTSATEATSTSEVEDTSFMEVLSQVLRANTDSIQSTMDELGLTLDDLTSEENMATLASAMNQGAADLGLPTIDNLDDVVNGLMDAINATTSETVDATAVTAAEETENGSSSGGSSSSDDSETTTEIVTINGVTYLETTTTENGIETTTRTVLSTEDEV